MPEHIPYIRVFISSPGDVTDERKIALDVIKRLPNRPSLRDRIAFRIIAWDEIGADTPMRATLTPQVAINEGLPTPSECDIVVVLFWSRMGTPFIDADEKEYMSGTHWELLDALNSARTETLIYRRTEESFFKSDDKEGQMQYEQVKSFFKSDLFHKDGRIVRGINLYASPDDFREKFETHFEAMVVRLLHKLENAPARPAESKLAPQVITIEREPWNTGKSPFPGLRAFTEADADIYFGRGHETYLLTRRLANERFLAVVGASGSGKSSLVGAGLIPRLRANVISSDSTGSKDWFIVTLKPGKEPFEALAEALMDTIPALAASSKRTYARELEEFANDLQEKPDRLRKTITHALKSEKAWAETLIFIDQFEEFFTLASTDAVERFAAMLIDGSASEKLRFIVTLRDDFYHRANAYQDLSELLQAGSFSLTTPRRDALRLMIERPAERADLEFEQGLVEKILDDTGDEPGGLALMAYALDELYKLGQGHITIDHYNTLGGVKGAIGTRAENTFTQLSGEEDVKMAALRRVFHQLVEVDERGTATRQRALLKVITADPVDEAMVKAFVEARLLVTSEAGEHEPLVEVAHEALLRKGGWKRLAGWIAEAQEDLILLRQLRTAAEEWSRRGQPAYLLWHANRIKQVYAMFERQNPKLNEIERDFVRPLQERLLDEVRNPTTSHVRRAQIGEQLDDLGDPRSGVGLDSNGLPEIEWCLVKPGNILIEEIGERYDISSFYIAKYHVTWGQFRVFREAEDGYKDERWWVNLGERLKEPAYQQLALSGNRPVDNVSWYEAVAFSRWLSAKLGFEVRLPTEWEWQLAATGGNDHYLYPWGTIENPEFAKTEDCPPRRSVAVGMYLQDCSPAGAFDMAGNVREWCLNEYQSPYSVDIKGANKRAVRGGSWFNQIDIARVTHRWGSKPTQRFNSFGMRLACDVLRTETSMKEVIDS